jgi:diguanylate cyclase (GGDEF)-like protein
MTSGELRFRAALSRIGIGIIGVVLLPLGFPETRRHVGVWIAYLAVAAVEQFLIRRNIGGRARTLVSGLVDVAVLTYTVHLLGTGVSPMSSLYLFCGVANALVGETGIAFVLAVAGPLAFDATVLAEHVGWIAFAPDVPDLAAAGAPNLLTSMMSAVFVSIFVPAGTAVVVALATALQRREDALVVANRRLEELSQLDPLTNLYNRRHLFTRIDTELARVRRAHPLALIMLDLDGFKKVNDTQGHLRGDVLLKEIATALAAVTRVTDVAGRYGGDEFVVLLPDTGPDAARVVADRIARAVHEAGTRFDRERPVTASLGLAFAEPADTVASLLRRADEKAYRAKQGGGDSVVA